MGQGLGLVQLALQPAGMALLIAHTRPGRASLDARRLQHALAMRRARPGLRDIAQMVPGFADLAPEQGLQLGFVGALGPRGEDQVRAAQI